MNYSKIKKYDISNGTGIRCSVFFTGCDFHCPECFNPELWDKNSGKPFDETAKAEVFSYLDDEHCSGLSVLGGEPLIQGEELVDFLEEVRTRYPEKDIWLWTGYEISKLKVDSIQREIIKLCDYVIDGQFKVELSKKKLRFRGSANQIIWRNENGTFVEATDIANNNRFK
jgi:anaerobic ribonucleoside-triphosphate reductase activating protein